MFRDNVLCAIFGAALGSLTTACLMALLMVHG